MDTVNQLIPYALVVLVGILLYFLERDTFNKVALAAFLAVEKELSTAEGQEKMSQAVLKIIETLPLSVKIALNTIATLTGKTLNELTLLLAQKTYDLIFKQLHPSE